MTCSLSLPMLCICSLAPSMLFFDWTHQYWVDKLSPRHKLAEHLPMWYLVIGDDLFTDVITNALLLFTASTLHSIHLHLSTVHLRDHQKYSIVLMLDSKLMWKKIMFTLALCSHGNHNFLLSEIREDAIFAFDIKVAWQRKTIAGHLLISVSFTTSNIRGCFFSYTSTLLPWE